MYTYTPFEDEPKLTSGEKARVAYWIARIAKRGLAAGNSPTGEIYTRDLEKKLERVLEDARRRIEREEKAAAKADRSPAKAPAKVKRAESRWW